MPFVASAAGAATASMIGNAARQGKISDIVDVRTFSSHGCFPPRRSWGPEARASEVIVASEMILDDRLLVGQDRLSRRERHVPVPGGTQLAALFDGLLRLLGQLRADDRLDVPLMT